MATSRDFIKLFSMREPATVSAKPDPDFVKLFPGPPGLVPHNYRNIRRRREWFERARDFRGLTVPDGLDRDGALFDYWRLGKPVFYKTVYKQRSKVLKVDGKSVYDSNGREVRTGEPLETVVAVFPDSLFPEKKWSEYKAIELSHLLVAEYQLAAFKAGLGDEIGRRHPLLGGVSLEDDDRQEND